MCNRKEEKKNRKTHNTHTHSGCNLCNRAARLRGIPPRPSIARVKCNGYKVSAKMCKIAHRRWTLAVSSRNIVITLFSVASWAGVCCSHMVYVFVCVWAESHRVPIKITDLVSSNGLECVTSAIVCSSWKLCAMMAEADRIVWNARWTWCAADLST